MASNQTLEHPALGPIIGVDSGPCIQYKGVPYATLEHQLADAVLFENPSKQSIDATHYGPQAIQPTETCDMEFGYIQHALPHGELKDSGTECLNLNITVPKGKYSGLPVYVFIHGGGYFLGAGSWPHFDSNRLVALSEQHGQPVIGISINYRLGAPGFLTSEELRSFGIKPDRGLSDQVMAFTWIQRFIKGFGGDPQRVTAVGVSAGSISILLHLCKTQPLFQQAVSMGGTPCLVPPVPVEAAEGTYKSVLQSLDLASLSPAERVQKLKETARDDWISKLTPGIPLAPIATDVKNVDFFMPGMPDKLISPPGCEWCPRLMIGDCEMDTSILVYMLGPHAAGIEDKFCTVLKETLPDRPDVVDAVLKTYDIQPGQPSGDERRFLRLAHDAVQFGSVRLIANRWPASALVFHFNELNPWEGRFQGVACHLLDVVFLFQNYEEFLDEEQAATGKAFGRHFIEFVNGNDPYGTYASGSGKVQVYGPGKLKTQQVDAKDVVGAGRRDYIYSLTKDIGLHKLVEAVNKTLH